MKILESRKSKNNYLIIDATIDALQHLRHISKSVYIKYLVTKNGDLKECGEITREALKERFKKHLNEYVFNSCDELDNALQNDFFTLRKKRFENVGDLDYTYILV